MSNASRITLLVFLASVAAVLALLGYVTARMLDLEQQELHAKFDARRQEDLRLALWRMDSVLSPIIAQEAARPYFHYLSYYPEQRAFTRVWEPVLPGEVIVPSPLVEGTPPFVLLHFQLGPMGTIYSPQVPQGNDRDLAESEPGGPERIERYEKLLARLGRFASLDPPDQQTPIDANAAETTATATETDQRTLRDNAPAPQTRQEQASSELAEREYAYRKDAADIASSPAAVTPQIARAPPRSESRSRPTTTDDDLFAGLAEPDLENIKLAAPASIISPSRSSRGTPGVRAALTQSRFVPRWRTNPATGEPELIFWRTVRADHAFTVQGFWIDWPALRDHLLTRIEDVLPGAMLEPVTDTRASRAEISSRLLATIPAMLVPPPTQPPPIPLITPPHITLGLAWLATLGAIATVGLSLRASISLGERRGRFVSAVTHELRTPLTTFCLYSQMLADGMVTDDASRAEYLQTLKHESTRLQRIVENVLDFARLGRARAHSAPTHTPSASLQQILDHVLPTLTQRVEQSGMSLELDIKDDNLSTTAAISSDAAARVLVNLVDNACKYASDADDKRITLSAQRADTRLLLTVADRGPGVPPAERRRIFNAFARGKHHETSAAQGLGLGLSLARAIARQHGGELLIEKATRQGAAFTLDIPILAT
ncbi:MAG: HAMP domain-containing histidine kinase [Phycisphaeraceae bacterium]|nr:HAMP domain-containing histidine kinase [Phycisphaeraceae bacterium]